jgi:hypothetical protein
MVHPEATATSERLRLTKDTLMYLLLFVTITMTSADVWSHPHVGVADLERRRQLTLLIGEVARHIGNWGVMAVLTAINVILKHTLLLLSKNEKFQSYVHHQYLVAIAALIAINAAVENTLNANQEGLPDFAFGLLAILTTLPAAELLVQKIKTSKQ